MNDLRRIPDADARPALRRPIPVGALREIGLYGGSILLDLGHRLLHRRKRGRDQVFRDYDQGVWRQQLEARNWDRAETLDEYLGWAWLNRDVTCLVDGRLWRMPIADYYRIKRETILGILMRFAGDAAELVELGSGSGANLFALYLDGAWPSLRGLDLSPTGCAVARAVAARFGIENRIAFGEIDLLDRDSPSYGLLAGKAVFTHYCLEQLPHDTELVLRNLHAAGISRAIHFEPSFELLKFRSLRDLASMSYVWRQDYQRTLLATARKLEAEGLIRILAAERLSFSPTFRNAPTLLVWEPA